MSKVERDAWRPLLAPYRQASVIKASRQLANSLLPFLVAWASAYLMLEISRVGSWLCCVVATGFLLRIYIIQHDCGHSSFLPSARANDALGSLLGTITLLPYYRWRHDHARHHATGGNLARRGTGDVWTMTLDEYRASDARERRKYRFFRNPLVLFGLGPIVLFVVWQRVTGWTKTRREVVSVYATNVAILVMFGAASYFLGWGKVLAVQVPITWLGSTIAVWLFYVQHQFEGTYWASPPNWDFTESALRGASWYRLPPWLQWFTGNIGLHHIHHLSPKIPNYELSRCLADNLIFQRVPALTLRRSLRCVSLKVWDESTERLLTWAEVDRVLSVPTDRAAVTGRDLGTFTDVGHRAIHAPRSETGQAGAEPCLESPK